MASPVTFTKVRPISRQIVGTSLSAYELPVDERLGRRGIKRLQLETNGNFLIHSISVVLSQGDHFGGGLLSVQVNINRQNFNLEAHSQSEIKRMCLQEVRARLGRMAEIRRVVANGNRMNINRNRGISANQACDFIADQALDTF